MPEGFPGTSPRSAAVGNPRDPRQGSAGRFGSGCPRSRSRCSPRSTSSNTVWQLVPQEHLAGTRDHGLPAMCGGHQAGAPVDRQARVAGVVDDHRLVGVQPDPGPQWVRGTPGLRRERLLESRRRADGVARRRKRCRHPVAHPREHVTPMGRNRFLEQLVVTGHRGLHRLWVLLPQPRRPFEVGEQECHRPRRWMPGHEHQINGEVG